MISVLTVLQKGGENVPIQWERINTFARGVLCSAETAMMKNQVDPSFFKQVKAIKKNVF